MDYNKLIFVENFHSSGYYFKRDTKFTIIEKIEKKNALDNIPMIIEIHEDKRIKHFQTLTPNGFKIKVNHPQNTALK